MEYTVVRVHGTHEVGYLFHGGSSDLVLFVLKSPHLFQVGVFLYALAGRCNLS